MSAEPAKRKLTTILAADVIGYSRLMAEDEEGTMSLLRAYRQVIDDLVGKHGGWVFKSAGDAVLVEFTSAVEAVRCAISIQEDLAVRNAQIPEDRQMWFRIGINVGDVMIEDDDLFGDGVNVAARLEGIAEKGGICISGTTFEQVKNKLSIGFEDIGAQQVKNIPHPVSAFRIVPGQITVAGDRGDRAAGARAPAPASRSRTPLWVGLAVLVAAATGGALAWNIWSAVPTTPLSAHPFDGHWRVTLDSLTGCRNNDPKSYVIRIQGGKVDEPQHALPKKGAITDDGEFNIVVRDKDGSLLNTQTGKLTGDAGSGTLQGRKPGCGGNVTLVRLKQN